MHAVDVSLFVVTASILISLNTKFRNKLSVGRSVYASRVAFVFVSFNLVHEQLILYQRAGSLIGDAISGKIMHENFC